MAVTTRKIDRNSRTARKTIVKELVSALSKTRLPFFIHKPGYDFQVTDAELFASGYTAALNADVLVVGPDEVITHSNLAISATAEKFKTTQIAYYMVGGLLCTKAATDNLVFTAAHVVTALKFGVILIQINAAGTVSTKVPAATQAYNTAALALAALPDADADNVALGYIAIEADAGDWTANTDDLTNGSDLTSASFVDVTESAQSIFDTPNPAFAFGNQKPTLSGTVSDLRGSMTDFLVGIFTSNGSGALVNGSVAVEFRPYNMNGDGGLGS